MKIGAGKPHASIVTMTGDRPEAFALCEKWMSRQTFEGRVQWIVVDDGRKPTQCTLGQQYFRRNPQQNDPTHTISRNLQSALTCVEARKVIIVEDDDFYSPTYVESIADWLDFHDLAGEGLANYYHVGRRLAMNCGNQEHASLCSTGFTSTVIPAVLALCENPSPFIDQMIWRLWARKVVFLPTSRPLVVGIKGMPGRKGAGSGHDASNSLYQADQTMAMLRGLIGNAAGEYARFYEERQLRKSLPLEIEQ